jgi:hypothetical protein
VLLRRWRQRLRVRRRNVEVLPIRLRRSVVAMLQIACKVERAWSVEVRPQIACVVAKKWNVGVAELVAIWLLRVTLWSRCAREVESAECDLMSVLRLSVLQPSVRLRSAILIVSLLRHQR